MGRLQTPFQFGAIVNMSCLISLILLSSANRVTFGGLGVSLINEEERNEIGLIQS